MTYPDLTAARVVADSVSPHGHRLVTLEVTFPRFVLAEFNTHRALSRNSASSRAIPISRQLDMIQDQPFVPQRFPVNRPGMSADEYFEPGSTQYAECAYVWLTARDAAVKQAEELLTSEVHKQIANRLLEPFMWHTVIVSATDWDNFFELRISPHAQPEICHAAELMRDAMRASSSIFCNHGEWHLPFIFPEDGKLPLGDKIKVSTARCAAASFNRHNDRNHAKELPRYDGLSANRHLSPLEHPATPVLDGSRSGNYQGWRQARRYLELGEQLP